MPGFVIPLAGPNAGYPGTVSRNGDEVIVNRPLAITDTLPAYYGDVAWLNQNSTGGTWSSVQALAVALATTTSTWSGSVSSITVASGTGIVVGQVVTGPGIAPGTTVSSISGVTVGLSVATTGSQTGVTLNFLNAALASTTGFAGFFAVNMKVDTQYPITGLSQTGGYYNPGQLTDAAERGSVTIQLRVYTTPPVSGGTVYVRIAYNAAVPAGVVGGLETAADGNYTLALPASIVVFKTGAVDPNGRTEVTLKTRNNP